MFASFLVVSVLFAFEISFFLLILLDFFPKSTLSSRIVYCLAALCTLSGTLSSRIVYCLVKSAAFATISKLSQFTKSLYFCPGSEFNQYPAPGFGSTRFKLPLHNVSIPYRGKKAGHKINRVKLLVGGNFSHLHIKLFTFPRLDFGF